MSVSASPYVAIFSLISLVTLLRIKLGVSFITWFFFTLAIVYLGGIIVIFIYLSSLIQTVKIRPAGARGMPLVFGATFFLGLYGLLVPSFERGDY